MPNVTSVWDFSPGETLTAAKLDDVNCGIHVFSGTATRDAAYGGSGERTLAEGEFAYLADSNTTQYYDGAAWKPVATTPGLIYITGASFSAVSSVSAPNDTFTSTYKTYKIVLVVSSVSTLLTVTYRNRVSGTDVSSNDYRQTTWGLTSAGGATNQTGDKTSFTVGEVTNATGGFLNANFEIVNPTAASISKGYHGGISFNNGSNHVAYTFSGQTSAGAAGLQAFDSFSFIASTGNMTGFYRVYGYSES